MKCSKCGFVSFDYLSECGKCGTDLADTREALGFDAAKPAVPFFLGALLRDYVKPAGSPEKEVEGGSPSETNFSLDFGEENDQQDAIAGLKSREPAAVDTHFDQGHFEERHTFVNEPYAEEFNRTTSPGIKHSAESMPASAYERAGTADTAPPLPAVETETPESEGFNLLDLSDEELDLLLTGDDSGREGVQKGAGISDQQFSDSMESAGESAGRVEHLSLESVPEEAPDKKEENWGTVDDLELDLRLDEVLQKPRKKGIGGLFPEDEEKDASPAPVTVPPGTGKEPIEVGDENFQITLSEKDLESLLAELESVSPKNGKKDEKV